VEKFYTSTPVIPLGFIPVNSRQDVYYQTFHFLALGANPWAKVHKNRRRAANHSRLPSCQISSPCVKLHRRYLLQIFVDEQTKEETNKQTNSKSYIPKKVWQDTIWRFWGTAASATSSTWAAQDLFENLVDCSKVGVKFEVNNGSGYDTSCFKIEIGTDTAKFMNLRIATFGKSIHAFGWTKYSKLLIKNCMPS